MAPVVLTVLGDYPMPATTGLHLRMTANLELVRRIAGESHLLWFATPDRSQATDHPRLQVDSVVCGGARVEQHEMSVRSKVGAKVSFAVNGRLGRYGSRYPFSMRYDAVDAPEIVRRRAMEIGADFVVLPSQCMHWAGSLEGVASVVVDAADVLSSVTRQLMAEATGPVQKLSLWANHVASVSQEQLVLPEVREIWATTHDEAEQLREISGGVNTLVIPNAIDESTFVPLPPAAGTTVGFLGTYSYSPNLSAARELADRIFPYVVARLPDARLSVVGGDLPEVDARRFAGRGCIDVRGRVEDLDEWWSDIAVAAFPIRLRGGVPLKLIEALARGRAVVATPELVAGLDLRDGNEVLIRDTPRSFADAVADVLTDRDLRTRLESAGRTAFEATFSYAAAESELRAKSSMIR